MNDFRKSCFNGVNIYYDGTWNIKFLTTHTILLKPILNLWYSLPLMRLDSHGSALRATTPRPMARAMATKTEHTATIVSPRSSAERLFHQVGFLKQNKVTYIFSNFFRRRINKSAVNIFRPKSDWTFLFWKDLEISDLIGVVNFHLSMTSSIWNERPVY